VSPSCPSEIRTNEDDVGKNCRATLAARRAGGKGSWGGGGIKGKKMPQPRCPSMGWGSLQMTRQASLGY